MDGRTPALSIAGRQRLLHLDSDCSVFNHLVLRHLTRGMTEPRRGGSRAKSKQGAVSGCLSLTVSTKAGFATAWWKLGGGCRGHDGQFAGQMGAISACHCVSGHGFGWLPACLSQDWEVSREGEIKLRRLPCSPDSRRHTSLALGKVNHFRWRRPAGIHCLRLRLVSSLRHSTTHRCNGRWLRCCLSCAISGRVHTSVYPFKWTATVNADATRQEQYPVRGDCEAHTRRNAAERPRIIFVGLTHSSRLDRPHVSYVEDIPHWPWEFVARLLMRAAQA